jgi:hypothetical protein
MATEVKARILGDAQSNGIRTFWMKIPGYVGLSAAASETVANYTENPLYEDLIILDKYMVVYEEDAQDGDLDIGFSDDAIGTNADDALFDSPANTAEGVLCGMVAGNVDGTVARSIWRARGSTADSFITSQQNGNADVSSLRFNLLLLVAYLKDFAGGNTVA